MKATTLLCVLISTLLPVASAFSQRAGQDTNTLAKFQNALERDGFYVIPGILSAQSSLIEKRVPGFGFHEGS